MKSILSLFCVCLALAGCSKKNDPGPVTINGKTYGTVEIGGQTWTTSNYDGPGGTVGPLNNESSIGKYYLLSDLSGIVLPNGWRTPTQADYVKLIQSQGSLTPNSDGSFSLLDLAAVANLKSTSDWPTAGNNNSGINITPDGEYNAFMNTFIDRNYDVIFWTSTKGTGEDLPSQCVFIVDNTSAKVDPTHGVLNYGYFIRFVKDD